MPCSASYLYIDLTLWMTSGIYDNMVQAYHNMSYLDKYDCALTTVPCESDVISAFVSLDHTAYYWFDLLVMNILLTIVVVVGVVGNIVNIVIFSTHQIVSDSTNILLLAVAASDLLNLFINAWLISINFLCYVDVAKALTAFNLSIPTIGNATRFLGLLSLDLVSVMSLQRAIAVLLPFKVNSIFSQRNTKIVIVTLAIVAFCTFIILPLSLIHRRVFHPYFNQSLALALENRWSHEFVMGYITYFLNSRSGFDLILLIVTLSLTVIKLRSHAKARATMKSFQDSRTSDSKMSTREASMVKMSLAVSLFTFIFYTLSMTANEILQMYLNELFTNPLPVINQYCIFVFNSICSSFNFFLYMTMSPKYRRIVGGWFKFKIEGAEK